ncbi:MAG: methyltransferase domain-containing protein [Candidatus Rokubacteria bacterium]|nr:methyltransferase domain-containing protein [Candidatus Rokubacteria bacterium]
MASRDKLFRRFPCIVDLRSREAFERLHPAGAWRLEPAEIAQWPFALPPRDQPVFLVADDPGRARAAGAALRAQGRMAIRLLSSDPAAWPVPAESGPGRPTVWPSPWLAEVEDWLPPSGRALDLATGAGRNAVWLALRGLEVTAVDRLPDALERAERLAQRLGESLMTRVADLRRPEERPGGSWDLVCVFRYLNRDLFPWIRAAVSPGGIIVFETFVGEPPGAEGPKRPANRLHPGELKAAFDGFEILRAREAEDLASIVARRP